MSAPTVHLPGLPRIAVACRTQFNCFARQFAVACVLAASGTSMLHASPELAGIACRSVHLSYPAPQGSLYYNEVEVRESHPGTYFCVCGFSRGYFGLQELASGKKLIIFSIWDPGRQDNPDRVEEERRVKLLHRDEAVRVGRFGNEGTGGQSFFDYEWKTGQVYRFCVKATVNGEKHRTEYAAYFFVPEAKAWKHLVTFDRPTKDELLSGYYSFVEDFRRNRVSATLTRTARYGNGWVRDSQGEWHPLATARFTGDGNPVMNIDAGIVGDQQYFLSTGGEITNQGTKLNDSMSMKPAADAPTDLPGIE